MKTCYFNSELSELPHLTGVVNYLGNKDGIDVYECKDCGLVFVPQVSLDEYLQIYKEPGNYYETSVSIGYRNFNERFEHDYEVSEIRLKNLQSRIIGGGGNPRVLDVGCGNCALLKRLRGAGFDAVGVDLDVFSVNRGMKIAKAPEVSISDFIDYSPNGQFDAVLFTDSFEHFLIPHSCAKHAVSMLTDNGILVLEMPDTDCDGFHTDKIRWRHVKPREHPFLYAQRHVESIFAVYGFRIFNTLSTIPGRVVYYLKRG